MSHRILSLGLAMGLALTTFIGQLRAQPESDERSGLTEAQDKALSIFAEELDRRLTKRKIADASGFGPDVIITPGGSGTGEDGFGGDPTDGTTPYPDIDTTGIDLPFVTRKSGAAELIALETLYQTLMFYGVVHIVDRKGSRKEFRIIESRSGYFKNLSTLDLAFAIREFSRYLVALMCNDPSQANFDRLISQTNIEEIGLRFKYDMAWTLFGNFLPREPNDMYKLGTRWKALTQILQSTRALNIPSSDEAGSSGKDSSIVLGELRSWASSLGDVVNVIQRLNKMMCFVNIRPDPREEMKKRRGINFLAELDKRITDRYADLKDLVDQVILEGKKAQIKSIKEEP